MKYPLNGVAFRGISNLSNMKKRGRHILIVFLVLGVFSWERTKVRGFSRHSIRCMKHGRRCRANDVVSSTSSSTTSPRPTASSRRTTTTTTTTQRNAMVESATDLWTSYTDALETNPLLVKSVTASVILGAADFAGQALEKQRRRQPKRGDDGDDGTSSATTFDDQGRKNDDDRGIDWARAGRFAFFGLVLQAPWNHFYYRFLDGALPPTPEPFTTTTGIKVLIDQFIQAPVFTILIFLFLGLLEGKTFEDVKRQLDADYTDTMMANWKLWVPATVVNIGFCPPALRVLFLNCVFFFWSIFLSLQLNKEEEKIVDQ